MQERLVVSNNSKRIERQNGSDWIAHKVEDAGNLRAGVYPLYSAKQAVTNDPKALYAGTVLHMSDRHVFQELGKNNIVKHDRAAFEKAPEIGRFTKVQYDAGKARIVDRDQSRGQEHAIGR